MPALSLDQAVGLRTVTLGSGSDAPAAQPPAQAPPPSPTPIPAPAVASVPAGALATAAPSLAEDPHLEYAEVAPRPDADDSGGSDDIAGGAQPVVAASTTGSSGRGAHAAPGVRATGVWLVVIGVTVVMAFADALVVGRTQLGWLTGIALLAASVYGALVVRREDAIIAVIAPPLAFFLATITAGQLTLPPTGDLLVREAFMIITTLGANAVWIFGSTIVALVIVLVRRRRSAPATPSPQP
ncbi:MAG: hypothetical protein RLZ94_2022 [Actinomycetota bacterium]